MSTYTNKNQKLLAVNNGTTTSNQYKLDTANSANAAKTTAATTQPVNYQQAPVDRKQYQYDASTNKAYQQALAALQAAQKDKPTYAATYDAQLDEIYNQIVNRKPFQYDINSDMLYQQYKDQYTNLGQLAMRDTMGQAAALTGGYGNTYAQAAGQQQYDAYLQKLNEVVPTLYGMAQDQYNREGEALQQQFAMTGDLSDREYGRYQDALNQYWQNVSYQQNLADNEYNRGYENWYNAEQLGMQQDQFNYQQYLDKYDRDYQQQLDAWDQAFQLDQFDYQKELDAWNQNFQQEQFAYQQEQDAWNQNFQQSQFQYQKDQDTYNRTYQEMLDKWNKSFQESQFAYQKEQDSLESAWRDKEYQTQQAQIAYEKQLQAYNTLSELITATGYAPSAAELQAAGMTQAQADAYRSYYSQQQAQAAASRSSGDSGGGGGYIAPIVDDDGDGTPQQTEATKKAQNKNLSGDEIMKQMGTGPYAKPTTYTDAIAYLEKNGVPKGTSMKNIMKQSDWAKYKALAQKNNLIGEPGSVKHYMYSGTYQDYLDFMVGSYIDN
jgi:hypothetical protein